MKPQRICPISNTPLPPYLHGNAKYHPQYKKAAKQVSNAARYERIRDLTNTALMLNKILSTHYPHSTGTTPVAKAILDKEGFKWDFNSRITTTEAGPVFWILEYGYRYTNNQKQIIIYGG